MATAIRADYDALAAAKSNMESPERYIHERTQGHPRRAPVILSFRVCISTRRTSRRCHAASSTSCAVQTFAIRACCAGARPGERMGRAGQPDLTHAQHRSTSRECVGHDRYGEVFQRPAAYRRVGRRQGALCPGGGPHSATRSHAFKRGPTWRERGANVWDCARGDR